MTLLDRNLTEEGHPSMRKFLLAGGMGIAVALTLIFKGTLLGLGEFAGNWVAVAVYQWWSGVQQENLLSKKATYLSKDSGQFPPEIFRPIDGMEYHLMAGHRYKLSLSTFEKRNISVRKGSISVQYDGGPIIKQCSSNDFEVIQYYQNFELVPCSDDSVFVASRPR